MIRVTHDINWFLRLVELDFLFFFSSHVCLQYQIDNVSSNVRFSSPWRSLDQAEVLSKTLHYCLLLTFIEFSVLVNMELDSLHILLRYVIRPLHTAKVDSSKQI